jgi:hypothetical protein
VCFSVWLCCVLLRKQRAPPTTPPLAPPLASLLASRSRCTPAAACAIVRTPVLPRSCLYSRHRASHHHPRRRTHAPRVRDDDARADFEPKSEQDEENE